MENTPPEHPPWYRWQPVVTWPLAGCLLGLFGLRLLPELPLGLSLFDLLQLHRTWPILLLALTYLFWRIGAKRQVLQGKPTLAPAQATIAALGIVLTLILLVGVWGTEWPLWWWVVAFAIWASVAAVLVTGWFSYSEFWRTRFHRAVKRSVERQIRRNPDRMIQEVIRRREGRAATVAALDWLAEKSQAKPGIVSRLLGRVEHRARRWLASYDHAWASPHALAILDGLYYNARHQLLLSVESMESGPADDFLLDDFVRAGECLVAYLSLNWPAGTLGPEGVKLRQFRVQHELIFVSLWFGTPPRQSEFSQLLLGRVPDWLEGFQSALSPGLEHFRSLFAWFVMELSAIARPGEQAQHEDPVAREYRIVQRIREEFGELDFEPLPELEMDPREFLAEAWLVLVSRVEPGLRLEVWEWMRDWLPETVAITGTLRSTLARMSRAELETARANGAPERWQLGFRGLAESATEAIPAAPLSSVRAVFERQTK